MSSTIPLPPREQLYNRYCSNKHSHTSVTVINLRDVDHDPVQLVEKLKNKYSDIWNAKLEFFPDKPGWTPTHWMTTWLPFGYMCMRKIAAKYVDSGVTDATTKHGVYVASKTFTPSHITKWVSTIEHAWAGWRNTVTDPEHMAAVAPAIMAIPYTG
jgi:hypothetical protein